MPHTVEEAYELADAAHSGDDAKLLDELGDVLFQVYFLSLLLEERGQGSLAEVAEHCREKLIRRHPHVFGDRAAETAGDVVRNWNEIKRDDERGGEIFGEIPETLPSTLYAKKVLKRAAGRWTTSLGSRTTSCWPRSRTSLAAGEDPELALRQGGRRVQTRGGGRLSGIDQVHGRQILDSRGNPTRRGRRRLEVGRRRAGGGALGCLDRRVRGGRAARRRRRLGRQGRDQGGRERERRAGRGGERPRPRRPGGARPRDDRARRHPEQGAAGRERDPRRVARRGEGGGRGGGRAAVALPRGRGRARAAGADDERAERRRARRQQGRLPGVHGRAGGRADLLRGPAHRRGGVPRAQAHAPRPRAVHGGGRRGRLRAGPRLERGRARDADRRDRGGRLPPGRRRGDRPRSGHQRDLR